MTHSLRLAALRAELAARGLDGFVVPLTDEHMSEYVGAYAQRLGWLTGFGGSAGTAHRAAATSRDARPGVVTVGRCPELDDRCTGSSWRRWPRASATA